MGTRSQTVDEVRHCPENRGIGGLNNYPLSPQHSSPRPPFQSVPRIPHCIPQTGDCRLALKTLICSGAYNHRFRHLGFPPAISSSPDCFTLHLKLPQAFRMTVEQCPQTDSHMPFLRGCAPPKQGGPKKEEGSGLGILRVAVKRVLV